MPTTPFEDNPADFAPWTTLSEELRFLQRLTAASQRVGFCQCGTSHGGKPLYEVRIGYPNRPTDEDLYNKSGIFIIGLPHGNEPSGREATFQFMRNLAESTDPNIIDYLASHPMIIVPTHNADGFPNGRLNAAGLDPNRQYMAYATGGPQLIGRLLAKYRPQVVIDCHEHFASASIDFEAASATNPEALSSIKSKANELYQAVRSGWLAAGFATRAYAGGTSATIARNNIGLRNRLSLLIEATGNGNETATTRKEAVAGHLIAFNIALNWHKAEHANIDAVIRAADKQSRLEGISRTPITYPSITPPVGYQLTDTQYSQIALAMKLLRIKSNIISGSTDRFVYMGQESKRLIPILMDAASADKALDATPINTHPTLQRESVLKNDGGNWVPLTFNFAESVRFWRVSEGVWQ